MAPFVIDYDSTASVFFSTGTDSKSYCTGATTSWTNGSFKKGILATANEVSLKCRHYLNEI